MAFVIILVYLTENKNGNWPVNSGSQILKIISIKEETVELPTARSLFFKRNIKKVRNLFIDQWPRTKVLVFEGYQLKLPEVEIIYRVNDRRYISVVSIDLQPEELASLNSDEHHPLFFNLGLAFAPSHFLISDFASVHCECANLNADEIDLIEKQILNSLTEFRYLNGLDPSRKVTVTSSGQIRLRPLQFPEAKEKALLLNGGGKDSCVSAELLKKVGLEFAWLSAHPNAARDRVIQSSGVAEAYTVNFKRSPRVTEDAAYPWGLIPYLAAITAASLIVAYVKGFKYIVNGAEHSADDPNLIFKGVPVNHQNGKTTAFDNFINAMCQNSILKGITSFSIARPFTDIRLAEMFSHFSQYNESFLSCNDGMGRDQWCNKCHKCAFTYLALYPFVGESVRRDIFGEELFEKPIIRKYILELTTDGVKPWECVGTLDECRLALHYCLAKSPNMQFPEQPFREELEDACRGFEFEASYVENVETYHLASNIPKHIDTRLRTETASMLEITLSENPDIFKGRHTQPATAS